jgi:hypothetical protein
MGRDTVWWGVGRVGKKSVGFWQRAVWSRLILFTIAQPLDWTLNSSDFIEFGTDILELGVPGGTVTV